MSNVQVHIDPWMEIVARKLFSIETVPRDEQRRMVQRCAHAVADRGHEVEAERDTLKTTVKQQLARHINDKDEITRLRDRLNQDRAEFQAFVDARPGAWEYPTDFKPWVWNRAQFSVGKIDAALEATDE